MMEHTVKAPALFLLVRDEDETGVSGTGVVAKGVELPNGSCLMKWVVGPAYSIVVYETIKELITIHGHNGKTRIEYLPVAEGEEADRMRGVGAVAENTVSLLSGVARMALTS